MPSHRSLRMAEAIREVVSSAILFEVADPRVRRHRPPRRGLRRPPQRDRLRLDHGDGGRAGAGDEGAATRHGFLQALVAARLQTRFTPVLTFKRDESVKKSIEMSRLIDEALAADRQSHRRPTDPGDLPTVDPDRERDRG